MDPRTGEFRYIGRSSRGLYRPRLHARGETSRAVHQWAGELAAVNTQYEICVLEEPTETHLCARETWWISFYKPFGTLLNVSDGGVYETDARAGGRASWNGLSPEQQKERVRRMQQGAAKRSVEDRRQSAREAFQAMTPQARSARSCRGWKNIDAVARSKRIKQSRDKIAPEKRLAIALKATRVGQIKISSETRSMIGRLGAAALTHNQLCERNRKVAIAREAKRRVASEEDRLACSVRWSQAAKQREANKRAKRLPRLRINLLPVSSEEART